MRAGVNDLLLVLHILGVAVWLGSNVAQAFLGGLVGNASPEVRAWYAESGSKMARVVYNAAGVLILATGLIMVIGSQDPGGYSFKSTFVSIGLAAIIVGAALGITVFAPKNRELAAAIREGDEAKEKRLRNLIMQFGILDTLIVAFTIGVMVYKMGAAYKGVG
jgi:hypothetical protein